MHTQARMPARFISFEGVPLEADAKGSLSLTTPASGREITPEELSSEEVKSGMLSGMELTAEETTWRRLRGLEEAGGGVLEDGA